MSESRISRRLKEMVTVKTDSNGDSGVYDSKGRLISYHAVGSSKHPEIIDAYVENLKNPDNDSEEIDESGEDSKYGMFFDVSETELVDPDEAIELSSPLEYLLAVDEMKEIVPLSKHSVKEAMHEMGMHIEGKHVHYSNGEYESLIS